MVALRYIGQVRPISGKGGDMRFSTTHFGFRMMTVNQFFNLFYTWLGYVYHHQYLAGFDGFLELLYLAIGDIDPDHASHPGTDARASQAGCQNSAAAEYKSGGRESDRSDARENTGDASDGEAAFNSRDKIAFLQQAGFGQITQRDTLSCDYMYMVIINTAQQ